MCDPCKQCTAAKERHTWHAFGAAACSSIEKGLMVKVKNAVIDSCCSTYFRIKRYSNFNQRMRHTWRLQMVRKSVFQGKVIPFHEFSERGRIIL
jgi:hypothetical protein